ncbi:hypothetical protein HDR58_08310 [bacterium]|nr:hypothetical protein [bacterium]
MNESIIKEVKSIYSGKKRNTNPNMPEFGLESDELNFDEPKSFFNGVIEKLNIVVEKEDQCEQ